MNIVQIGVLLGIFGIAIIVPVCNSQTPYQASIRLRPQANYPNGLHLCNGALINESYILTTADCMYFQPTSSLAKHPVQTNMIVIEAGNIVRNGPQSNMNLIRNAEIIHIHPNFNMGTLENDIAIIKLNESLPLSLRQDVQWIPLANDNLYNRNCTASFYNPVNFDNLFLPQQSIVVKEEWFCSQYTYVTYSPNKKRDICSSYMVGANTMCNITNEILRISGDRGTPLICDNKVVGVLSAIVPPDPRLPMICAQPRKLDAFYTRIEAYLIWIQSIMNSRPSGSMPSYPSQQPNQPMYPSPPNQGIPAPIGTPPPYVVPTTEPPKPSKKNGSMSIFASTSVFGVLAAYFFSQLM